MQAGCRDVEAGGRQLVGQGVEPGADAPRVQAAPEARRAAAVARSSWLLSTVRGWKKRARALRGVLSYLALPGFALSPGPWQVRLWPCDAHFTTANRRSAHLDCQVLSTVRFDSINVAICSVGCGPAPDKSAAVLSP
jgi:hypothetical protein